MRVHGIDQRSLLYMIYMRPLNSRKRPHDTGSWQGSLPVRVRRTLRNQVLGSTYRYTIQAAGTQLAHRRCA